MGSTLWKKMLRVLLRKFQVMAAKKKGEREKGRREILPGGKERGLLPTYIHSHGLKGQFTMFPLVGF